MCLALAACAQTVPPSVAPIARLTGHEFDIEKEAHVVYAVRGETSLELSLWRPRCPGPHPVALVVHGGGWRRGDRDFADAYKLARALAREGIAAASISHRLAPRFVHPAQLEDCRSAMLFLRTHAREFDLDPTCIAAIGASSGGHLAALLATCDDTTRATTGPDCVVTICAPFDLLPDPTAPATPCRSPA